MIDLFTPLARRFQAEKKQTCSSEGSERFQCTDGNEPSTASATSMHFSPLPLLRFCSFPTPLVSPHRGSTPRISYLTRRPAGDLAQSLEHRGAKEGAKKKPMEKKERESFF